MLIKKPYSLKKLLLTILMISSLIPLVLIGYISYVSIYSLLNNNIESGIQNNLKQIRVSLGDTINNLESSSLQLAVDNVRISDKIEEYMATGDLMHKYDLKKEITDGVAIINAVKAELGLIFFYISDNNERIFENQGVDSDFDFKDLPVLSEGVNTKFFGPHKSADSTSDQAVFSIKRKIYFVEEVDLYVYMETNFKLFEDLLSSQQYDLIVSHVLVNNSGEVVYSQIKDDFPIGTKVDVDKLSDKVKSDSIMKDYYVFSEKGQQGWYALAAISKKDYNYEFNKWLASFALFALLSIFTSVLLAFSVWKIVYRPLKRLNREIGLMAQSKFNSQIKKTDFYEFDYVLEQFEDMKIKIVDLFKEIEEKERKKRVVEVENLLHQINPHFLHNTLNTIQWLARMNGQDEIDRIVALFTRVLHYNLGKEGGTVYLSEEIKALKDYIDLQRFRYDYQFDVKMNIKDELMDVKVPRFIMQPIVENALCHGLKYEDGTIQIDAIKDSDYLIITISDNGAGMTELEIEALFGDKDGNKEFGMGIGLSYVKRILDVYYGEKALLDVKSEIGIGTTFRIQLPII